MLDARKEVEAVNWGNLGWILYYAAHTAAGVWSLLELFLLEAVQEAGLTGQVSAVQLSSTQLTLRYLDRFDVKMKLNADFSYDLRLMETVRLQIEEKYSVDAAGSIDLTQSGYDAVYAPAS